MKSCTDSWDSERWNDSLHDLALALLSDWGAGLKQSLYRDALVQLCPELVMQELSPSQPGRNPYQLLVPQFPDGSLFHFSTQRTRHKAYEQQLRKWFNRFPCPKIHWLNLNGTQLHFQSLFSA